MSDRFTPIPYDPSDMTRRTLYVVVAIDNATGAPTCLHVGSDKETATNIRNRASKGRSGLEGLSQVRMTPILQEAHPRVPMDCSMR